MLPGLYSAATGLEVASRNQEAIAHNLAHVSVPGFRRSVVSFETFSNSMNKEELGLLTSNAGAVSDTSHTDFTPGSYQQTGRKLDVAIQGDGFFAIEGPSGPLYTRTGNFHLSPTGELINHDGYSVLGTNGPIQFPPDVALQEIEISNNGQVRFRRNQVGQIELTAFEDNQQLKPFGTTLFQATPDAVPSGVPVEISQGVRELSNVSPMHELVQMIVGMRFYEMSNKAMTTIAAAIQQNTDPRQGG